MTAVTAEAMTEMMQVEVPVATGTMLVDADSVRVNDVVAVACATLVGTTVALARATLTT